MAHLIAGNLLEQRHECRGQKRRFVLWVRMRPSVLSLLEMMHEQVPIICLTCLLEAESICSMLSMTSQRHAHHHLSLVSQQLEWSDPKKGLHR
jgi:hypothetical protein